MPADNFAEQREKMVSDQLIKMHIYDRRVLDAMREIPREQFVPETKRKKAYKDGPIRIGCGQTISQPYVVALMSELLRLTGTERILEIGTGSGYQTTILARLASEVFSVERYRPLAHRARELFRKNHIVNVHIKVGDGSIGWQKHAPYDGIIVTAAAPEEPPPLLEQLADGGRLVIPVGTRSHQVLKLIRRENDRYITTGHCGCRFVPLVGEYGWKS